MTEIVITVAAGLLLALIALRRRAPRRSAEDADITSRVFDPRFRTNKNEIAR